MVRQNVGALVVKLHGRSVNHGKKSCIVQVDHERQTYRTRLTKCGMIDYKNLQDSGRRKRPTTATDETLHSQDGRP